MAPENTEKLDAILEQLNEHRTDFATFRTEVLGSPTDEKSTGRLPRLEAISADHERRIVRIERFILLILGAAGLLKALAWSADTVAHVVSILRR